MKVKAIKIENNVMENLGYKCDENWNFYLKEKKANENKGLMFFFYVGDNDNLIKVFYRVETFRIDVSCYDEDMDIEQIKKTDIKDYVLFIEKKYQKFMKDCLSFFEFDYSKSKREF